uniref:ribosomal protein S3 n=1 Tax=Malassezia nana TaxID=180528 RepID=UPI003002F724|nr:ribosomal protein S3 [Malassezia nana]
MHIRMIRLHYPYMNSQILGQYLIQNANKKNFLKFSDSILTYPSLKTGIFGKAGEENSFILPSYIQNIRLELSGRLTTEKVVPRVTKKIAQISNTNADSGVHLLEAGLSNDTVKNVVVDYGKVTNKNELGSFTLKVWINSVITIFQ